MTLALASAELAPSEVADGLADLAAKSLAEAEAIVPRYRLLDTIRAYALEKLGESGERDRLARDRAAVSS